MIVTRESLTQLRESYAQQEIALRTQAMQAQGARMAVEHMLAQMDAEERAAATPDVPKPRRGRRPKVKQTTAIEATPPEPGNG